MAGKTGFLTRVVNVVLVGGAVGGLVWALTGLGYMNQDWFVWFLIGAAVALPINFGPLGLRDAGLTVLGAGLAITIASAVLVWFGVNLYTNATLGRYGYPALQGISFADSVPYGVMVVAAAFLIFFLWDGLVLIIGWIRSRKAYEPLPSWAPPSPNYDHLYKQPAAPAPAPAPKAKPKPVLADEEEEKPSFKGLGKQMAIVAGLFVVTFAIASVIHLVW